MCNLLTLFILLVCVYVCDALVSNFHNGGGGGGGEISDSRYIKEEDSGPLSDDDQNSANHFVDSLPGDPSIDYPTYKDIPRTGFSCQGKVNWRYYADVETQCQVFHVCETEYSKISFVCPIGSIFNQKHLVCDWWYNFDCNEAEGLYALSNDLNESGLSDQEDQGSDRSGFDLNLASSGDNAESKPKEVRNEKKRTSSRRNP